MDTTAMFQQRAMVVVLSSLALASCGGGRSSRGDAATSICIPSHLTCVGDLNGHAVDVSVPWNSATFQQIALPFTYDVVFPDGMLHLQWVDPVASGQPTAVSGTIVMPAGAPHAGDTICGAGGSIEYGPLSGSAGGTDSTIFTLTDLSLGPACPGTAIAGSLLGCESL